MKTWWLGRCSSMERHPDSDHLWICQVDVGAGEPLQIVTGAQNLQQGDFVPVALHNSTLPGGKKIKKGKLRGVESNGMLCSLGELGLTHARLPLRHRGRHLCPRAMTAIIRWASLSARPSALTTPWWNLKSPPTARTASPSSAWPGRLPPPLTKPLTLHTPAVKGGHGDCSDLLDVKIEDTGPVLYIFGRDGEKCHESSPPPAGCASVCAPWACVPSTTSWTSPTM